MHISGKVHKIEQKTDTDTDINENDSYQKRYGQILCKFQLIIFVCPDLINHGYLDYQILYQTDHATASCNTFCHISIDHIKHRHFSTI